MVAGLLSRHDTDRGRYTKPHPNPMSRATAIRQRRSRECLGVFTQLTNALLTSVRAYWPTIICSYVRLRRCLGSRSRSCDSRGHVQGCGLSRNDELFAPPQSAAEAVLGAQATGIGESTQTSGTATSQAASGVQFPQWCMCRATSPARTRVSCRWICARCVMVGPHCSSTLLSTVSCTAAAGNSLGSSCGQRSWRNSTRRSHST